MNPEKELKTLKSCDPKVRKELKTGQSLLSSLLQVQVRTPQGPHSETLSKSPAGYMLGRTEGAEDRLLRGTVVTEGTVWVAEMFTLGRTLIRGDTGS